MSKRINELLKDISSSPHDGIGKPEPLKHALGGYCRAASAAGTATFTGWKAMR